MFSKAIVALTFVLGLTLNAHAHAIISPALGVTGAPVRNDVQRPSTATPCGNVNIAKTVDSTTPIQAQAGAFTANITNFNAGVDGSRQVTAKVDATGTGKSFVNANVVTNGDKAPTDVGSQTLAIQMPAGTTCTGGANKDLCLVSFTTAGGFGNCVAVQQAGAAAAANGTSVAGAAAAANGTSAAGAAAAANGTSAAGAAAAANGTAAAGGKHKQAKGHKAANAAKAKATAAKQRRIYGRVAARALRRALEEWM